MPNILAAANKEKAERAAAQAAAEELAAQLPSQLHAQQQQGAGAAGAPVLEEKAAAPVPLYLSGSGEKEKELADFRVVLQNSIYGMKTLLFSILYCSRQVRLGSLYCLIQSKAIHASKWCTCTVVKHKGASNVIQSDILISGKPVSICICRKLLSQPHSLLLSLLCSCLISYTKHQRRGHCGCISTHQCGGDYIGVLGT